MNKKQRYFKIFLTFALIAMIFKGFTQVTLATEFNYKVVDIGKPTSSEINLDKAAEIGVQNLYLVFGLNTEDKILEMRYFPEEYSRHSKWEGTFWINGKRKTLDSMAESYSFSIDSNSGEVYSILHERILDKDTDIDIFRDFSKIAGEYENLAKGLSTKLGVLQETIKTAKYNEHTGILNNDPCIYIEVTSESGKRAELVFSLYDKKLVGINYDIFIEEQDTINKAF